MATANDYKPLDLAAFEGHTQGEWVHTRELGYIEENSGLMRRRIAIVDDGLGIAAPLANGELLAAAPQLLRERNELLAALKDIIDDCADSHSYIDLLNKIEFGKIEPWGNQ